MWHYPIGGEVTAYNSYLLCTRRRTSIRFYEQRSEWVTHVLLDSDGHSFLLSLQSQLCGFYSGTPPFSNLDGGGTLSDFPITQSWHWWVDDELSFFIFSLKSHCPLSFANIVGGSWIQSRLFYRGELVPPGCCQKTKLKNYFFLLYQRPFRMNFFIKKPPNWTRLSAIKGWPTSLHFTNPNVGPPIKNYESVGCDALVQPKKGMYMGPPKNRYK